MFPPPGPWPKQGIGNAAFSSAKNDSTSLFVLTGIYGIDHFGKTEELSTELLSTYTLTDADKDPAQRLADLLEFARPHIESLQSLSVTTHEGSGLGGQ